MPIQVLGIIQLIDTTGRSRQVIGGTQRKLLAALAASPGRPVSSAALVAQLWEKHPPRRPLPALYNLISRLRYVLGEIAPERCHLLETHPMGYVLNADEDTLDSMMFESLVNQASKPGVSTEDQVVLLRRALELWRGEAFTGVAELPEVSMEAVRLEHLRYRAIESFGAALTAAGKYEETIEVLEPFLRENAFREQAQRTLAEALYRSGRQTDALAHLRGYRRRLMDELGLEPSAVLRDLELALLRHEMSAVDQAPVPVAGPPAYRRISQRMSASAERLFVGRKREVGVLVEALAPDDSTAVVYLHGPGGIGKSTLLAEARRRTAELNWLVIDGADIDPAPERFLAILAGRIGCRPQLVAIADELAGYGSGVLAIDGIERMQAMDAWLRLELLPMLPAEWTVVISGRNRPDHAWRTSPEWWGLMREIQLAPFEEAESTLLLQRLGVSPARVAPIRALCGGYPIALALGATVALDDQAYSDSQQSLLSVAERLVSLTRDGLSAEQRHGLEVVSVVRRITLPLLHALLEGEGLDAGQMWDFLCELPFVSVSHDGIRLHDMVRDSVAHVLGSRDPRRSASYRRRAFAYLAREIASGHTARDQAVELFFLLGDPVTRSAFFPPAGNLHTVDRMRDHDETAIKLLLTEHVTYLEEGLINRWRERDPGAVLVSRGPNGDLAALGIVSRWRDIMRAGLTGDPVVAGVHDDLRRDPPGPDADILLVRRLLALDTAELPSPQMAVLCIEIVLMLLRSKPGFRHVYISLQDTTLYSRLLKPIGFNVAGVVPQINRPPLTLFRFDFG
ncbi:BTAD domain-containing putative transcriptional regulator [Streptosporangium sp. OZ121]|uniref:BTAD domain-containing putative transcriptional regulator n=1 Tax=Streptosporangium sp. OZ121 TaxID=3444183 RepID=UPI003F78CEA3